MTRGPGEQLSFQCFWLFLPFGPSRVSPTEQRDPRAKRGQTLSQLLGARSLGASRCLERELSAPVAKESEAGYGQEPGACLPLSFALAGPLAQGAGRARWRRWARCAPRAARRRRAAAEGSWRYAAWPSTATAWAARRLRRRRLQPHAARRRRRRRRSQRCACSAIWTTATAAYEGWCLPSRPTRKSVKWRSCSTLSTTSWTCSWPLKRTRLCWGSRPHRRHRTTRPGPVRQLRRGLRSQRSTPTRWEARGPARAHAAGVQEGGDWVSGHRVSIPRVQGTREWQHRRPPFSGRPKPPVAGWAQWALVRVNAQGGRGIGRTLACHVQPVPRGRVRGGGPQGCRLGWENARASLVSQDESRTVTSAVFAPANLSFGVPLLFQAGAVNKQGDSILCRWAALSRWARLSLLEWRITGDASPPGLPVPGTAVFFAPSISEGKLRRRRATAAPSQHTHTSLPSS